jgi:hypothetical protein
VNQFEAVTPFSDEIFNFILRYANPLFNSEQDFKKYVINCFGDHGTEIFITHMKKVGSQYSRELILSKDGDIVQNPEVLAEYGLMQPPDNDQLSAGPPFIPMENSLR